LNPIFDQIRGRGHQAFLRALPAKHSREVRVTRGRTALEAAGVEFTNGDEPGVKLRKGKP
jgi:hypothetical protein